MTLSGKIVWVTGAGTGIGRAVALELDRTGHRLTLVGRRAEPLAETAAQLSGDPCIAPADIIDEAALKAAVEAGVATHGPLHGLVANAGLGGPNEAGAG